MRKALSILALIAVVSLTATAQSRVSELGKWMEIENDIIRSLNKGFVDSLPTERMMLAGINAMLDELDPYTVYIPEDKTKDFKMQMDRAYGGLGAIIHKEDLDSPVVINEIHEGSPAHEAGLNCADRIIAIDGKSVAGLNTSQCSDRMKGTPGTTVKLKVIKVWTNDTLDIVITRREIKIPDISYYGMLSDGSTGYIVQSGFTEGVAEDVAKAYKALKKKGMKRLVIDLRNNPGGLMEEAIKEVSLFVPTGSIVVCTKSMRGKSITHKTETEPLDTKIPLAILINEGSASASEIVSGALQDLDRAYIFGERSYGKGLVQNVVPVGYDGHLKLTIAKYYTPSGRCIQAIDYSERDEDGNAKPIPDSLTHEFRTVKGRIVRDGGGITPDYEVKSPEYSRMSYILAGIISYDYVIDYVSRHTEIPPLKKFRLTDEDYEDFIKYALSKDFKYSSTSLAILDRLEKELKKEELADSCALQLEALRKAMSLDKEAALRKVKDEILPVLEYEIAARYYFSNAAEEVAIKYDSQLKEAVEIFSTKK